MIFRIQIPRKQNIPGEGMSIKNKRDRKKAKHMVEKLQKSLSFFQLFFPEDRFSQKVIEAFVPNRRNALIDQGIDPVHIQIIPGNVINIKSFFFSLPEKLGNMIQLFIAVFPLGDLSPGSHHFFQKKSPAFSFFIEIQKTGSCQKKKDHSKSDHRIVIHSSPKNTDRSVPGTDGYLPLCERQKGRWLQTEKAPDGPHAPAYTQSILRKPLYPMFLLTDNL